MVSDAVKTVGYKNALAAELTRDLLLRNHKIATGYRCFNSAALAEICSGNAPTIRRATTRVTSLRRATNPVHHSNLGSPLG